jgi:N-methylhydantoinase A/oxoprolinase/acetone carboxylase beta subunit
MRTVIIPPHPGVLSALGVAVAPERVELVASLPAPAEPDRRRLLAHCADLERQAQRALPGGATRRYADARFIGQGYEITIPLTDGQPDRLEADFRAAHRARFGHDGAGGVMEVVSVRVVVERAAARVEFARRRGGGKPTPGRRRVTIRGSTIEARVWSLGDLPAGRRLAGPAILAGPDATALIEPGWRGVVHTSGAVVVQRP